MFGIFIFAIILLMCFTKRRDADDNLDSLVNERIQNRTEGVNKKEIINYKAISYYQLAKNIYYYEGKRITFNGKVLQVIQEEEYTFIRFSINDCNSNKYNNNMVMLCVPNNIITERILEDEYLTIKGIGNNLFTYETIWGAKETIPYIIVEEVSRKFKDFFGAFFY